MIVVVGCGLGFVLLQALITQWNGEITRNRLGFIDPECTQNSTSSLAALYRDGVERYNISDFVYFLLISVWGLVFGLCMNGFLQLSSIIALFLTVWENHRTIRTHEGALTKKVP